MKKILRTFSNPQHPAHSPDRDRAVTPSPSPEVEYTPRRLYLVIEIIQHFVLMISMLLH